MRVWTGPGLAISVAPTLPAPGASGQTAESPGSTLAFADAEALREAITTTPDFPDRVADAYRTALATACGAASCNGWRSATLGFIASLRNGPMTDGASSPEGRD